MSEGAGQGNGCMAIIADYDFGGTGTRLDDGAAAAGSQGGFLLNGAHQAGGALHLDGCADHARIAASEAFQIAAGSLTISFTRDGHPPHGESTVLSRDSAGSGEGGHFSLATSADGAILVHHGDATDSRTFATPAGFLSDGDRITVRYAWDASGRGGALIATNETTGAVHSEAIGAALTMDLGDAPNEPWIIGASAERAHAGQGDRLREFFEGSVERLSFADDAPAGGGNGLVEGTAGDDLIDIAYTGDPEGDRIDAGDALLPGAAPDDDFVIAGAGNDTILAGAGNDFVRAGDGDDLVFGGAGNDTLDGWAGQDTLFGGDGDDAIEGGGGDDEIHGEDGDDTLFGGNGNDRILGGAGADVMTGGDDRDTFFATTADDVIDGGEGGDDFDTLDLRDWGRAATNIILDPTNPENGIVEFLDAQGNITGTLTFSNIENIVPCFTPGTLIATPRGERAVEDLQPGDRVVTRDNGLQEIRWTGARTLDYGQLAAAPHLKPILIARGSLGEGLPEHDMLVSPNHRMLVANERTALYFEDYEVLVAAKHLVNHKGVRPVEALGTTYVHFLCDRHEVVLANGAWTESFQPGDQSLNGMGNAQRNEIFEIFPELRGAVGRAGYKAARRVLKRHEARLLNLQG